MLTTNSRKLQLLRPGLSREQISRLGQSFRDRQEQAKIKQQQMREFATNGRCRWQSLLATFDSDELNGGCGHCDDCAAQSPELVESQLQKHDWTKDLRCSSSHEEACR